MAEAKSSSECPVTSSSANPKSSPAWKMPVARPTSCAFGGANFDELYITSASRDLEQEALAMQPNAGGLFMVTPGVRGIEEVPFAG